MTTKTIKQIFPLLCVLACLAYGLDAQIINEFPNGAVTLNSAQTISGPKDFTATPTINANEVSTRAYVDMMLAGVQEAERSENLKYYFTKDVAITGYRWLLATSPAIATEAATFTVSATNYTEYTLPHVSPAIGVATLPAGEVTIVRYMMSNQSFSSGRNCEYVSELYFADDTTYANETFVATFTSTILIGQAIQTIFSKTTLNADMSTGGTTRVMLLKHYWKRTGVLTSNNPAITVYCGGQYAGYVTTQLPSAVVMRTDASNAVAADARTNLDVYSKGEADAAYHPRLGSTTLAFSVPAPTSGSHATNIQSEASAGAVEDMVSRGGNRLMPIASRTWTTLSGFAVTLNSISLGQGVGLAANNAGKIYRTTDYGLTWSAAISIATETGSIWSLCHVAPGIVCAGGSGRIYRSSDSGVTWNHVSTLATETGLTGLASINDSIVLGMTRPSGWLVKSTDAGLTWASQTTNIAASGGVLLPLGNGVVIAAVNPKKIFRSVDSGSTWTDTGATIGGGTTVYPTKIVNCGYGILISAWGGAAGDGRFLRSVDSGATWTDSGNLGTGASVFYSGSYLGRGYALFGTNISKNILTTDFGETWSILTAPVAAPYDTMNLGAGVVIQTSGASTLHRSVIALSPSDALAQWLADDSREVRIATSTDAGDYKLQVNGNVYISATCSAAAFEDRSAAPDTVADAYAIVQSHEAKNGHVDHSKLHPKLWGTKPVQVSSKQVEKQVAVRDTEGKETEDFETITVQEPVIEIVPDQSKRNLSMLISAQSEVLKDIDRRLKALENNK